MKWQNESMRIPDQVKTEMIKLRNEMIIAEPDEESAASILLLFDMMLCSIDPLQRQRILQG